MVIAKRAGERVKLPQGAPFLSALVVAFGFVSAVAQALTFTVTNISDSGGGSLRQAIIDANNSAGADTIAFLIPGVGVHTITPTGPLPTITDPVTIDGYTQPTSSANTLASGDNAVLRIELNGGPCRRCSQGTHCHGGQQHHARTRD